MGTEVTKEPPTHAQYSRYFWIVKPSGIYSLIICANQRCLTKSFEVTVDFINGISLGNCGTLNPTSRCVWVLRSRLLTWTEYRRTSYSSRSAVNQVGWKWWPMKHICPRPVLFLRIIQPFLCSFLYHTQWQLQAPLAQKPNVLVFLPSERRSPNISPTITFSSSSCKSFLFKSHNCLLIGIKCEVF